MTRDMSDLVLHLFFGSVGEDLLDDDCCFLVFAMVNELAGRFRAEGEETAENNCRNSA